MRALRFHEFGGPEALRVEELERPRAGPGEVLVRVHLGGFNFADTERRRGLYLSEVPLPDTLGFEGCGVVEACGPGVETTMMGERVAFIAPRAHAEWVAVPVSSLLELPEELDDLKAAAFPVQGLTAWNLVHTAARVRAGEVVAITGAAGGVGQLLIQLARRAGATVVGIVSSEKKAAIARARGAQQVVLRGEGVAGRVLAHVPRGVDVLFDGIGRELATDGLAMLAPFGRWVNFGEASGKPPPVDPAALYAKSVAVSSYWLRTPHSPEEWARGAKELVDGLVSGALTMEVAHPVPFAKAWEAHAALESGLSTGKLLLQVKG